MQSDKKPEDFDSMNEYIDHLRNDVILDKEKFEQLDKSELLARASIGASITLKGIEEKLETAISPEFMTEVAKQELDANKIIATIKAYKENNLSLDEHSLYLNDELTINKSDKHADALVSAYQKLEPEMTPEQVEDTVMNLKASSS
jgi:ribosomal protein L14E/L6E/L27E